MTFQVRSSTLQQWVLANTTVTERREFYAHGIDAGIIADLIPLHNRYKLYDRFQHEIWQILEDTETNPRELSWSSLDEFKSALLSFAITDIIFDTTLV